MGIPPARPQPPMRLPVNHHDWDAIGFLHWPFEPVAVAALLPGGLEVQTIDGAAWVGVTPFRIRVRLPGMRATPPGWAFPETNVRTYVRGPDDHQGLWFLHMEVTAAWFAGAMRGIGLPYVRQHMDVALGADRVAYRSRPGTAPGGHEIVLRPGAALVPPTGRPLEQFLTARWSAYHRQAGLLLRTPVEHPPWSLHAATAEVCDVDALWEATGLPAPSGPPLAHWSPGVPVRVGRPRLVRVPATSP